MSPRRIWQRVRRVLVHRILRLDDTPHRIAFGVFLGFLIGWTPTIGAQIFIYWIVAALLRANKVSGILPILLTNPITAVPVYYFNWMAGRFLLTGRIEGGAEEWQRLARDFSSSGSFSLARLFESDFWNDAFRFLASLGAELWLGCLVVGFLCGAAGYAATWYMVTARRNHKHRRRAARALLRRPRVHGPRVPAIHG